MEISDSSTLLARYVESCERFGVAPHSAMLAAFGKVRVQGASKDTQILELCLDHLGEADALPLVETLTMVETSKIEAVDVVHNNTLSSLKWQLMLQMLRAAGSKLRMADLRDNSFSREALRELFQGGLDCQILDLSFSHVRKLEMSGHFPTLHTLKLDYSLPVTSLPEGCFHAMPKLAKLSMCGTNIANLWTTCAALVKLPSLLELRFQKCLCCQGTGQCTTMATPAPTDTVGLREGSMYQGGAEKNRTRDWVPPATDGNEYASPDTEHSDFSGTEDDESDGPFSVDSDDNQPSSSSTGESSGESERDLIEANEGQPMDITTADDINQEGAVEFERGGTLPPNQQAPWEALEQPVFEDSSWGPIRSTQVGTSQMLLDILGLGNTDVVLRLLEPQQRVSHQARHRVDMEIDRTGEATEEEAVVMSRLTSNGTADLVREVNRRASYRLRTGSGEEAGETGAGSSGDEGEEHFSMTPPRAALALARHPSPICYESHYREFMISTLPALQVLDNILITERDREAARCVYKEHFEPFANKRNETENVLQVLKRREKGGWGVGASSRGSKLGFVDHEHSPAAFSRSLSAAKMASCPWPATNAICRMKKASSELSRRCRPRQFEYHPTEASYMVFGTLHGEVVVVNHESDKVVGYVQSIGAPHSILGLCWLNKDPHKLIAGSDNGSLQLYDINHMRASMVIAGGRGGGLGISNSYDGPGYWGQQSGGESFRSRSGRSPAIYTYDYFEKLTSVHINSTDDYFLASGYSKHVGLYDLRTGTRLQIYPDLHQEHINVVKFAHHSPNLFATSSFDKDIKMWDIRQKVRQPLYTVQSTRGNVMVCFSQDDHYILSSAVDNEVRQHLAVDGRLHMKFDIPPMGSNQNYTRSYYLNGRDYIITGSCEENVVRICCAQTGRRLRDLALEGRGLRNSLYVQSLRGDPFKDFHFCVLVAYNHPHSRSEIVKVNLLARDVERQSHDLEPQYVSLTGMGA